jgi:hypothetical protein
MTQGNYRTANLFAVLVVTLSHEINRKQYPYQIKPIDL